MLRDAGFDVTLAINGRLALEILDEGKVDLVLTMTSCLAHAETQTKRSSGGEQESDSGSDG